MTRPVKLTPALTASFCRLLARGAVIETAAASCGIHRDTVYAWLERGRAPEHLDAKGEIDQAAERAALPFRRFTAQVVRARAKFELRLVAQVLAGKAHKWRAAFSLLERMFPLHYGPTRSDPQKASIAKLQREKLRAEIDLINATLKGKLPPGSSFTLDPSAFDRLFQRHFGALPARPLSTTSPEHRGDASHADAPEDEADPSPGDRTATHPPADSDGAPLEIESG